MSRVLYATHQASLLNLAHKRKRDRKWIVNRVVLLALIIGAFVLVETVSLYYLIVPGFFNARPCFSYTYSKSMLHMFMRVSGISTLLGTL